ncbi:MAG: 5-carboxymethyl-2-oxo-hex-3- ene-1,7-dioate decarboxylase [Burkholderiaceae bacterium]|jgi:5-oxopent-3-ene-1,2,5-tricarboxylate decarboxylase/2-hydroxyhepta-2,4-diene-1,7-dioate isomerase|nr:MAG: 5-carboxymethyl-2-oxo-hex-3- ene-1,7-dioate decarboxylase [Burkholderiaceae bacterium]
MNTGPSFLPAGTVYGVLLNFRRERLALASQMLAAPYKAAPRAPVLYVKTANTWSPHGSAIMLPGGVREAEVGATIAMVIDREAKAISAQNALDFVASYVLLNDLSIPHQSFYRPPVKTKCVDGFLGVGAQARPAREAGDPAQFTLEVRINGALRQSVVFSDLVRSAAQLLVDVTEFMTLAAGDLLMLGCDLGRPLAGAGDRIEITSPGFAPLVNTLAAHDAAGEAR